MTWALRTSPSAWCQFGKWIRQNCFYVWDTIKNFWLFAYSDPEMIHINSSPEAPPPRIRILDSRAREVETVRIGDRLTFRIEIPEDSKWNWRWKACFHTICWITLIFSFQQHHTVSLPDLAWLWLRTLRALSRSSTMTVALWTQPFSRPSLPMATHCSPSTKLSASLRAMALYSSVTSSTVWDHASR